MAYIQSNCSSEPCEIRLADATDFGWDKFHAFEMRADDEEVRKTIGTEFSSKSDFYSRKWFFFKNGQLVKSEEHVLTEIDKPIKDGDVIFEMTSTENDSSSFENDVVFQVKRNDLDVGAYYSLHCIRSCVARQ